LQFGAPSHRVESLLRTAAAVIDVDAEFLCLPAVIVVGFGKHDGWKVNTHWIKSDSVIGLSALHDVHHIYRQVIHDKMSAETAREELIRIIRAPPLYGIWVRDALAFLLSALICPLAFGGSFIDLWIAGAGAALLNHVRASIGSPGYVVVFELFIAMFTSFVARALGSINPQAPIFCYNAISSSSILSILPGFLILTAALELASKQMTTGGVKMVFALMYTLLLGFGLSIGSDLYLLLGDVLHDSRTENIIKSCLRLESAPWYRQPFPTWTQFLIVPAFSITSSFAHGQKWQSREFVVMILISCAAYACNALANAHMHSRSDFVAAIGGLAVGFLGNTYSRLSNFFFRNRQGTAFNVMVVGILFMVPSGLSETGGLTARGSAVDIGGAMIGVSVGITVGLFIANAVVYAFGRKKTGASFSM
ncbi:DUF1212-domain-containing protein, partial [Punctularia strigosozonata HHB-11173 SS5]|uniref:DUF1212-domain-containing protein n=1 Tax=Punctularia strigosozonata (strain HHB-11173) TaxID=741275 RepID=UPI0004416812